MTCHVSEMREFFSTFKRVCSQTFHIHKRYFSQDNNLKPPWRVVFFGTDDFALNSLKMLYAEMQNTNLISHLSVVCAQSNCSVARFVSKNNLNLINWKPSVEQISEIGAQIGLVSSFGHLIPSKLINAFPLGMINVHASLLPRWRGAAPIVHAILNRDAVTGVSIMRIRPHKFDEGEIISTRSCAIGCDETALSLTKRLSVLGADELRNCLQSLHQCLKNAQLQPSEGITYAPKIDSSMSICDWYNMTSDDIYTRHLALSHVYLLQTTWNGQSIKLFECRHSDVVPTSNTPGDIVFNWKTRNLLVTCKNNSAVFISKLKLPNKPPISAIDFLNGYLKKVSKEFWKFI